MTNIPDDLVERMERLVRDLVDHADTYGFQSDIYQRCRAVVAALPVPVDPDIAEAEKLLDRFYNADNWVPAAAIFAGIKRGRELGREA